MITPAGICWSTASSRLRSVPSSRRRASRWPPTRPAFGDLPLQLGLLAAGPLVAPTLAVAGGVHHVAEGGDRQPDAEVGARATGSFVGES